MSLSQYTLHDFIIHWLETVKIISVKSGSLTRLYAQAKALEKYPISELPIYQIRLFDIQKYINALVDDGYRYTTIVKQRLIVTAPLRYAYAVGILDKDVTVGIEMPSKETVLTEAKDVSAFTEEEQSCLRNYLHDNPCVSAYLIEFLLETGLRVGEAQALCWSDVNMRTNTMRICRTALNSNRNQSTVVQNSPKTPSSTRRIPFSTRAKEILEHMQSQKNGDLVFQRDGKICSYSGLIKWYKHACEKSGIPVGGMHVLRHTFATNCYYKGCEVKILSKLLGHATTAITYNTYINLYGDGLEEMRSIVN